MQGGKARKKRIDDPQFAARAPSDLVTMDSARHMSRAGQVTGIVSPGRRERRRELRVTVKKPDLAPSSHSQSLGTYGHTHRAVEIQECKLQSFIAGANCTKLAGLIRRN